MTEAKIVASEIVPWETLPTCPDRSGTNGNDSLDIPAAHALRSLVNPKLKPNAPEFTPIKSCVSEPAMSATRAEDSQYITPNITHSRHHIQGLPNKSLQDSIHKPKPPYRHPGYRYDNYPKSAPVSPSPPIPADMAVKRFHEKLAKLGLDAVPAESGPNLTQEQINEAAYGSLALFEEKMTEKIKDTENKDIMTEDFLVVEETEKESKSDKKQEERDNSKDMKGKGKIQPNEDAKEREKMQEIMKNAQAQLKRAKEQRKEIQQGKENRQKDGVAEKTQKATTTAAAPAKETPRAPPSTPISAKPKTPNFAEFMAASKSFSKQYGKK